MTMRLLWHHTYFQDVLNIEGEDLVWCLTTDTGDEITVRSTVQGDTLTMVSAS